MRTALGSARHPVRHRCPQASQRTNILSVVIPVFNGAATIGSLVDALVAGNPGYDLQIVLVNDGSEDASGQACRSSARRHPAVVTFVDLARNAGEHNAVMAGLAWAQGDWCVVMDDDFQNPPEEAFRLAAFAKSESRDIVFGVYAEKRHAWWRNLGSRLANAAARRFMGLPDGLYLSSFKCLSRFTVGNVLAYRGPFPYVDGLALRATRNLAVLETRHECSRKGRSGYTIRRLVRLALAMAVNFSVAPLRVASALGLVFSLAGFAGAVAVVVERLSDPGLPVGWPSLVVTVLLLSGLQLLLLGILGEYLGQLLLTVNGTPQYVIREVIGGERGSRGSA
jgi:undecaprenyl-phosphate 4-deoxy-4-formamido-L-arabinose transferase